MTPVGRLAHRPSRRAARPRPFDPSGRPGDVDAIRVVSKTVAKTPALASAGPRPCPVLGPHHRLSGPRRIVPAGGLAASILHRLNPVVNMNAWHNCSPVDVQPPQPQTPPRQAGCTTGGRASRPSPARAGTIAPPRSRRGGPALASRGPRPPRHLIPSRAPTRHRATPDLVRRLSQKNCAPLAGRTMSQRSLTLDAGEGLGPGRGPPPATKSGPAATDAAPRPPACQQPMSPTKPQRRPAHRPLHGSSRRRMNEPVSQNVPEAPRAAAEELKRSLPGGARNSKWFHLVPEPLLAVASFSCRSELAWRARPAAPAELLGGGEDVQGGQGDDGPGPPCAGQVSPSPSNRPRGPKAGTAACRPTQFAGGRWGRREMRSPRAPAGRAAPAPRRN